jgi:hypothetical protein
MTEERSTLGTIATWVILGIVALIAFKLAIHLIGVVMGIGGMLLGLAMFLLFTVGPIILLGWLAVKAWQAFRRPGHPA